MDGWNCCVTGLIHEVGNSEEMAVFQLPVAEQRCETTGGLQPLKPNRRSPPEVPTGGPHHEKVDTHRARDGENRNTTKEQ